MYLWSKLSSIKWQDAWEERFYGNPNSVITEINGGKSIRVEVYCEDKASALAIAEQFGGSVRKVQCQNWAALSQEVRKPLKIRDKLIIAADGQQAIEMRAEYPQRKVIEIPAEMAFGTGDHATTSTCLRLLVDAAEEQKEPWEMLDLGCGTAVLAIAAKLSGASCCEAHDFDPQAVRVSESNVALNALDGISIRQQDVLAWEAPRQWDIVVANMFSTILQQAFPRIVAALKADGVLIISGILREQWEETKQSGEAAGLSFVKMVQRGKWCTARAQLA